MPKFNKSKIADDFKREGATCASVAALHGCSVRHVQWLVKEVFPDRNRRISGFAPRTHAIAADYVGGMSLREVGAKHGCSAQRVHQIVRRLAPRAMGDWGNHHQEKWPASVGKSL